MMSVSPSPEQPQFMMLPPTFLTVGMMFSCQYLSLSFHHIELIAIVSEFLNISSSSFTVSDKNLVDVSVELKKFSESSLMNVLSAVEPPLADHVIYLSGVNWS